MDIYKNFGEHEEEYVPKWELDDKINELNRKI